MTDFVTSFRSAFYREGGLGLLVLALVLMGCDSQDLGDANPETPSIAEITTEVRALSTLEDAVREAGLADQLANEGDFTVFAPLNSAFDPPLELTGNPELLRKVLRHHIVSGTVTADQLSDGQKVEPLAGDSLVISAGDEISVNRATVTNPDVNASNGVVHVVDGLLIDAVDRAALTPQFTLFARLVGEADLESTLRAAGANDGRTLFVPTNEAVLAALDGNGNGQIENDEIPSDAADILSYHVVDQVFFASDVPTSRTALSTLEGSDVTVVRSEDTVTLNPDADDATVTIPNVEVDNGVIHGIDTVLLP